MPGALGGWVLWGLVMGAGVGDGDAGGGVGGGNGAGNGSGDGGGVTETAAGGSLSGTGGV